jgi:ubiquinone/menaquinone biosynthesis C-methylase UbiE
MSEDRIHFIDKHVIDISKVELKGRILDVGGGGEGIVGQYKGKSVIAIDKLKSELEEAADGEYLKVIMDAEDLKFLDGTFDTVTAFYMFMYVPLEWREKIFKEIFRVLKPGGEFIIWDMVIVEKEENEKKFYGAKVEVIIGDKTIETGYATRWNKAQDLDHFLKLGASVGFDVIKRDVKNEQILIRFKKPK